MNTVPNDAMDILTWMQTGHTRYLFTVRSYQSGGVRVPTRLRTYGYTPAEAVALPDFLNGQGFQKTPKGGW